MSNVFMSIEQIRKIENEAFINNLNLMDLAANCIVNFVKNNFSYNSKILILFGSGNNGGDGILTAIKLHNLGFNLVLYQTTTNINLNNKQLINQYLLENGNIISNLPKNLSEYDLIIDAILGIGLNSKLSFELLSIINLVNNSNCCVLAIDTPTGLNPFTSMVYNEAIMADYTITFIGNKAGFYTGNGLDLAGNLIFEPLINSLNYNLITINSKNVLPNELKYINYNKLIRKLKNTNKGTFGSLLIIGGDYGMHGSLYLAGRAAILMGCGKVTLASIDCNFNTDLLMPEIMVAQLNDVLTCLENYSAIIIGPGFNTTSKSINILTKIIQTNLTNKLIFDADALNIIANNSKLQQLFYSIPNKIITPHPGEASKLLNKTIYEINNNRFSSINLLVKKYNAICLLKGAGSLIEDSQNIYINLTGNSSLANAGQGDTLCGIIGSLLCQNLELSDSLRLAVYIHGKAADDLSSQIGYNGILASEIIIAARKVLNNLLYLQ